MSNGHFNQFQAEIVDYYIMFFKHILDCVASIQALLMPTNNKIKFNLNEI